jgi:malonyl-CoA/methylmalonyl-CoA synthetase
MEQQGWLSAGAFDRATRAVAGRLHAAGLRRRDRVILSAAPSVALVEAYVAALRLGLVVVPLNPGYRGREVTHVVRDAEPRAAIVDDTERGSWIRRAAEDALILGPDVDLPEGNVANLDDLDAADPALICYTSGTTGSPKGAVLAHGNVLASAEAVRLAWRWSDNDRLVLALPLFHVHGLCVGLHGTLLAGGSAVLVPRFEPDAVLSAVGRHESTLFFGVPTMYHRLARSPRVAELGRLRLCVSGSAPLAPALWEQIRRESGQRVLERYGTTETLMNTSNPYDGERRPGSVGMALPGVQIRLDGEVPGEILVAGPNVFSGYWRNEKATADAFDARGWFRTGDIGRVEPDGYLRIEGRLKEVIVSGGFNVYPREVEEVLLTHPGVAEVSVVGRPSEEWGETVTAFVVPVDEPPEPEALLAFAAERLAAYKRPRAVRFLNALPRNATGKVLRRELPL